MCWCSSYPTSFLQVSSSEISYQCPKERIPSLQLTISITSFIWILEFKEPMPCCHLLMWAGSLTYWHLSGHLWKIFFIRKGKNSVLFIFLHRKADVGSDYPTFYVGAIPSTPLLESGLWQIKAAIYTCSATTSLSTNVNSSLPYSLNDIANKTIKHYSLIYHCQASFLLNQGKTFFPPAVLATGWSFEGIQDHQLFEQQGAVSPWIMLTD